MRNNIKNTSQGLWCAVTLSLSKSVRCHTRIPNSCRDRQAQYDLRAQHLLFPTLFSLIILSNILYAQNSEGGKPFSFDSSFRESLVQDLKVEILPAFDLSSLQAEDAINDKSKGPFRFGYNHNVNFSLNNSGTWITLPNGDRLWQLYIKSPGAVSMNLAFDNFFMPEGAKLFVYSADKSIVIGAFTTLNNQDDKAFATDLIAGDAIVLEYYEPQSVTNQGHIQLFRVTHGYRSYKDYLGKAFGSSGSCQENINCPLGDNWQNEKNAVMLLVTDGNVICTGTLINDVPQDSKPYVLTANHCSNTGYSTWIFRFQWEATGCTNPGSSPSSLSLTGCVKRAANPDTDMSLVEITGGLVGQTIPASYNPYFAGWSRINTPATSAIDIHHPNGDIKKISEATNPTQSVTYANTDCWRVGQWTTGCTEVGSSGSALFDQNHRIIGQLYGGPSDCGALPIDMYDNYGKFATSWLGGGTDDTQLKHWLDPDNTGTLTMDGTDSLALAIDKIDVQIKPYLNIYPNPSNGKFNIDLKILRPQNVTIKVIDILGQIIYSQSFSNTSTSIFNIDLSSETNGIYFLEISTDSEKSVKKINVLR